MAVKIGDLSILTYPAPALRLASRAVERIDQEVRRVGLRMIELMHEAKGVGLAGPQVGLSWRLFVANPTSSEDMSQDRAFINPILTNPGRTTEAREEGCLSIPNVTAEITRPTRITIEAMDLDGNPFQLTSEDLAARIWQHEIDHLDGVLIIDRMTPMDRMANKRILRDLELAL